MGNPPEKYESGGARPGESTPSSSPHHDSPSLSRSGGASGDFRGGGEDSNRTREHEGGAEEVTKQIARRNKSSTPAARGSADVKKR